jgi:hypothetical protein
MIVAQHEVLGRIFKSDTSRTGRRSCFLSIPGTSYRATFTVSLRDGARFRSIPGTSYRASTVSLRDSL